MRNARAMGVQVPAPGGNQLSLDEDRRTGMDGYVHLCMTTSHPMAYVARQDGRIKDIVWIKVNPHVIKLPGVMLTDVVSNSAACKPFPATEIDRLDLEVLYTRTDWRDPAVHARLKLAEKYEVLVPNHIHLNDLRIP